MFGVCSCAKKHTSLTLLTHPRRAAAVSPGVAHAAGSNSNSNSPESDSVGFRLITLYYPLSCLDQISSRSVAAWTGLDWTGLDSTGPDWTGLDWTGLDWQRNLFRQKDTPVTPLSTHAIRWRVLLLPPPPPPPPPTLPPSASAAATTTTTTPAQTPIPHPATVYHRRKLQKTLCTIVQAKHRNLRCRCCHRNQRSTHTTPTKPHYCSCPN